jgi:hypothetical protein
MRAFRIGYILTVSFLIVLTVVTLTFGFYSAPTGPKAPAFPSSTSLGSDFSSEAYQTQYEQYQKDRDRYEAEQKNFLKDKIVPYARNVFVIWIFILLTFQVAGMVLSKYFSGMIGAAFSFSGVWAVIFGPLGGLLWFVSSLVSSFGARAEEEFTVVPIFQAVGISGLVGVLVLTLAGIILYGRSASPAAAAPPPPAPPLPSVPASAPTPQVPTV